MLRVCFLLGRLGPSGGVRAVLEHARLLVRDHDMACTIAVAESEAGQSVPDGVELLSWEEARQQHYDVAVATWWETVYELFSIPATRRAYFIQNFEERLYEPGDPERLGAAVTHALPVSFITEARWIADVLAELRPGAPCFHVPNGIDKALFTPDGQPPANGPLRILVEGSPSLWFKGVTEAVEAASLMREPHRVTLVSPEPAEGVDVDRVLGPLDHADMPRMYAESDLLLKLSRVEGVFTPPLEAFHCGTTAVVWPVTGHDEYVAHGTNAVVAGWDDLPGTARWLDLLARDRDLLGRLRAGALETARAWPSWDQSARGMAAALREVAEGPEPTGDPARLLADVSAGLAELRIEALRLRRDVADRDRAQEGLSRMSDAHEARVRELEGILSRRLRSRLRRLLASLRP